MRTINFLGEYRNLISNSNNHLILQLIDEDVTEARPQPVAGSFNVSDYTKQVLFSVPITIDKTNLVDINFNSNPLNTLGEGVYFFNITDEGSANYPNDTFSTFSILEKGAKKSMFSLVTLKDILSAVDSKFKNYSATVAKGDKGDRGEQGIQGAQGVQGIQGERGIQGVDGQKGDKGERGPQGFQGQDGVKGDKGDRGEKGDTGDKGEKGDTGKNFNIAKTFSSVDYMNAYTGTEVSDGDFVLISTTDVNDDDNGKLFVKAGTKFNLLAVIRGVQGIKGDKGDPGEKGERGYKGDTGLQGPQGLTGAPGSKGDPGSPGKDSDVALEKNNVFTGLNTFGDVVAKRLSGINVIRAVPSSTTKISDLVSQIILEVGSTSFGNISYMSVGKSFTDAPLSDTYLLINLYARQARVYVEIMDSNSNKASVNYTNGVPGNWTVWANDAKVVHNTGDETVDGVKMFKRDVKVGNSAYGQQSIELSGALPYIDFHFGNSTADYTSRIIENTNGQLSFVNASGLQTIKTNIDGNSASTNKLKIAKNIAGVSFDGTKDIDLPGVNIKGNQDTSGKADTAGHADSADKIISSEIMSGASLNSYTNDGDFFCKYHDHGDIKDSPIDAWFTLHVTRNGDSNGSQTLIDTNTSDMYVRTWSYNGDRFTTWRKVQFTA